MKLECFLSYKSAKFNVLSINMTFISNSKQFIFIHPHKCAGSSIEMALSKTLQWNDLILGSSDYGEQLEAVFRKKFHLSKHSCAADIEDVVGNDIWHSYFTFSVVRHPLDRMVSLYEYLKKMKGKESFINDTKLRAKIFLAQNKQFPIISKHPSLQKNGIFKWPGIIALMKSRNFSEFLANISQTNAPGIRSQFDFLLNQEKSKITVDYVCKFENLQVDWQYICQKLNISYRLPHANKSRRSHKNWRDYYTLDDLNFMVEKYKMDLETFDYSV